MRWVAILGGTIIAAAAWAACWQEIQLVRLRRTNALQAAQVTALQAQTEELDRRVAAGDRALRDTAAALAAADRAALPMQRLQALLLERSQTIADVHEAAAALHIREGSREMQAALAQATMDLDGQIAELAGPEVAAGLGIGQPVPVFPPAERLPQPPVATVAYYPVYLPNGPSVADEPDAADAAPPAEDQTPLVGLGGIGVSRSGRGSGAKESQSAVPKAPPLSPAAGAGIPLVLRPSLAYVTTSPTLIEQEQHAPAATPAQKPAPPPLVTRAVPAPATHAVP